ncbi:MAG TPA: transposase, partial [Candidatus Binatia bacterium]
LSVANGVVRFEYDDYADPDARKELSLPATEFLRRFLLHVVPKGFMRIRHYGITATARRQAKLARCRELLGTTPAPPLPVGADTAAVAPEDTTPRCPQCGAPLRIIELLAPQPPDTS